MANSFRKGAKQASIRKQKVAPPPPKNAQPQGKRNPPPTPDKRPPPPPPTSNQKKAPPKPKKAPPTPPVKKEAAAKSHPPPPPPPTPQAPPPPPPPGPLSPGAATQQTNLLDAIRNHGGTNSLKRANTFARKEARGQERGMAGGGDMMSDLKAQMETRRKALSGEEGMAERLMGSVPYVSSDSDSDSE